MRYLTLVLAVGGAAAVLVAGTAQGRRASAQTPKRVASIGLTDRGSGTSNGHYDDGSGNVSSDHESITYLWTTAKNLRFEVPEKLSEGFTASANGTLVGSWDTQWSGSGNLGGTPTSFSCHFTGNGQDISTTAKLVHDAGSSDVKLTLYGTPPLGYQYFDPKGPHTSVSGTRGCGTDHQHPIRISPEFLFKSPEGPGGIAPDAEKARTITIPLAVLENPSGKSVAWPDESFTAPSSFGSITVDNRAKLSFEGCKGAPGTVTYTRGTTSVQKGDEVCVGQVITTGKGGRVEIQLPDGSVLRIGSDSKVELTQAQFNKSAEDRQVTAKLIVGDVWATVAHWTGSDAKFEIVTDTMGVGVRGTVLEVVATSAKTHVHAIKDTVSTRAAKRTVLVRAGYCTDARRGHPPKKPYRCGFASPLSHR